MKRMLKYASKNWCLYLIGFLALIIGIVLDLCSPIIIKKITDEVILGGNLTIFKTLLLGLLYITLGRAFLGYVKEMMFDLAGSKFVLKVRYDLFSHIQKMSVNFFDQKNTGELMSRVKNDAERVWELFAFGIMLIMEMGIYFIAATGMMIYTSWKLSLVTFISIPIIGYLALTLEKKISPTFDKISEQNASLNTTAQENIAGMRLVKSFAREKYEINKFLKQNKQYYNLNVEQASIWAKFFPLMDILTNVLPVIIVLLGGLLVISGELSIGTIIKFMMYINMVVWPMRMSGWLTNMYSEAKTSANKINKIFNEESQVKDEDNAMEINKSEGKIEFSNVNLEFEGKKVLQDINFTLEPKKTIAIMGATGAGKTSIINLLVRSYDVTAGNIYIDNINIKDIKLKSLRENISVVMQDVFLFSDTIKENISFGNKISKHDIVNSAKSAKAKDFIESMEKGYDTIIGERGIGLSGGQKQRISIARALAKKARIIVFDDSTSALDMKTENYIQREIEKKKDMSKVIIAHRISAVKNADEIIILDNGKIVERGNHNSLLQLKGRYYKTYIEQYEGFAV